MTTSFATFIALTGSTGLSTGLLALGMSRHHAVAFGNPPSALRGQGFRFSGWLFLTASLLVALAAGDGGIALLASFALLTAHAFVVTMLLTYAPRIVPFWTGLMALVACAAAAVPALY
jgi:hypothetical protein